MHYFKIAGNGKREKKRGKDYGKNDFSYLKSNHFKRNHKKNYSEKCAFRTLIFVVEVNPISKRSI